MSEESPKPAKKKRATMKEEEPLSLERKMEHLDKLHDIVNHMSKVNEAANVLVDRMVRADGATELTVEFGIRLIQRVRSHDISKLSGVEWEYLNKATKEEKPDLFLLALKQHWANNSHHPEFFVGGIKEMTDLDLAEMACDLRARSQELDGGGLRDFLKNEVTNKYRITTSSLAYRKLKKYIDILLDDTFG